MAEATRICFAPRSLLPSNSNPFSPRGSPPHGRITATKAELREIRVCTNRTCRKQGSMQTFETMVGLAPPHVAVSPCGCLGKCGAGPNLVALPDGVVVGHCGTAAKAFEVMMEFCGVNGLVDGGKSLEALALRKIAEAESEKSNFSEAEILLSQAINLKPFGGIHVLYKNRSRARLTMANYCGALEDIIEALKLAPQDTEVILGSLSVLLQLPPWSLLPLLLVINLLISTDRLPYAKAYICQGDIFLAMDQYDAAEKSYETCLLIDPSIRRSKSFKTRIVKLQEKLTAVNGP